MQQEQRQTTQQHNTAVMLVGGLLFVGGIIISLLGQVVQAGFIWGIGGMLSVIGFTLAFVAIIMISLLRRKHAG